MKDGMQRLEGHAIGVDENTRIVLVDTSARCDARLDQLIAVRK